MIEIFSDQSSDKLNILFATVKIIRACSDTPQIWKLNTEYLDLLCLHMKVLSHDRLIGEKFLDAPIDVTTLDPFCVGLLRIYPLIKV
jgi:hypothetical protein